MPNPSNPPLVPREGWHVMHLFYQIDHAQWALFSDEEKRQAKTRLTGLVQEIRATPDTHLVLFVVATPKADLGLMLLTPDLQVASAFEKQLTLSLGPEILNPVYSYLSLTESGECGPGGERLAVEKDLVAGKAHTGAGIEKFAPPMEQDLKQCLYPVLPDWPLLCFYTMSKRRNGCDNWYSLDGEARRSLLAGQARIERDYSGGVVQLITGSAGLDEYEWGVTLFAKDTSDVKTIVSETRFDEVCARYTEFGDFYIGMQLPLDLLFRRLCL
jgi:peroxiredoxin